MQSRRLLALPVLACLVAASLGTTTAQAVETPTGTHTHLAVLLEGPSGVEVRRIKVDSYQTGESTLKALNERPEVISASWDVPVHALQDATDPGTGTTDPTTEPAPETGTEPAPETPADPATEPVTEPAPETPADPATEPVTDPATEPAPETPADETKTNDKGREHQWALDTLDAEASWAYTATNPYEAGKGSVVAVIDSGVDGAHADFQDSDGTSVVLTGVDLTADGKPGNVDPNGHGTHVAGTIAAVAQNEKGIAGLAPGVQILPVRVLDDNGAGSLSTTAEGIIWAADNNADVINLSLGGPAANINTSDTTPLLDSIKYATGKGVLVVAAAGNGATPCPEKEAPGQNCGNLLFWPASMPLVESVAATDETNTPGSFSQHNPYVDLAAPGVCILSLTTHMGNDKSCGTQTQEGSTYAFQTGTSMAAPHVAAVAALVKAHWERKGVNLSPQALGHHLKATASDLGEAGRDDATGNGLVNLKKALETTPTTQNPGAPVITVPTEDLVVKAEKDTNGTYSAIVNYLDKVTVTTADDAPAEEAPAGETKTLGQVQAGSDGKGTLTAHCFPLSGQKFKVGTTDVNCTAVDKSGEVGYATFKVTVAGPENSAPVPTVEEPSEGVEALPEGKTPASSGGSSGIGSGGTGSNGTGSSTSSVPVPRVVHAG